MREILFRAYDKTMKRYKPFDGEHDTMLISREGKVEYYNLQNGSGFDEYILEQFTGLTDKNGVEIFEGDIVAFTAEDELWEPHYYQGFVYFCDGIFWVDCGKDRDDNDVLFSIGHALLADKNLQIIGNIHDNPAKDEIQP